MPLAITRTMTGYEACVRCGLCLPACPTYLETMTETSGPRGRISLIKAVDEGALDLLSPGFVEQMSQCLDCRACQAVCPSGVPYGAMLEEMRARIEEASAPARTPRERWTRNLLLKWLFAKPARLAHRGILAASCSGKRSHRACLDGRHARAGRPCTARFPTTSSFPRTSNTSFRMRLGRRFFTVAA